MIQQFRFEEYSSFARQIAEGRTWDEIRDEVVELEGNRESLSNSHLKSIERTTSMQSNSQARAHSRNSMTANYERLEAYKDAIELYVFYPERCKEHCDSADLARRMVYAAISRGKTEYEAMQSLFKLILQ